MAWELRRSLAEIHDWIFNRRKVSTAIMLVMVIAYAVLELSAHWLRWAEVNWMILTGLPVGLLFIWRTNDIRARFEDMADGLSAQGFLRFANPRSRPEDEDFVEDAERRAALHEAAKKRVEEDAALWGFRISLVFVPLCIFVLHLVSGEEATPMKVLLYLVVIFMAFACGLRIGRMACYGWQGLSYRTLAIEDCLVTIVPSLGHPDGGAGLAPIGRFYNHQVGKMAWLIGFLLVWLVILALFRDHAFVSAQYPPGTSQGLLALFVLIFAQQILGFFLPMWSIHRQLGAWKDRAMQRNFDALKQIEACRQNGHRDGPEAEDTGLVLRKLDLRHQRDDIAAMGLWPVSMETLRQFWFGKAASVSIALVAGYNDLAGIANDAIRFVQS